MTWQWAQLIDAVENYYGSGSDQWVEIVKYGMASDQAVSILSQVPGVNLILNADGSVRSFTVSQIAQNTAQLPSTVDSNVVTVSSNVVDIPAEMAVETGTTTLTATSGLATAGNFVVGEIIPAIVAAGVGITLGKTVDSALYHTFPDFFDSVGMSELDPDTWNAIASTDDSTGGWIFNTIFGLDPDGTATAYIDQDALAYMAKYLAEQGMFNTEGTEISSSDYQQPTYHSPLAYVEMSPGNDTYVRNGITYYLCDGVIAEYNDPSGIGYLKLAFRRPDSVVRLTTVNAPNNGRMIIISSKSGFTAEGIKFFADGTFNSFGGFGSGRSIVYNGLTAYRNAVTFANTYSINSSLPIANSSYLGVPEDAGWLMQYGNTTTTPGTEGIGTQDGATTPNINPNDSVADILAYLQETYPDLFNNAVHNHVVQPDGSIKDYVYIPINVPDIVNPTDTQPTSGDQKQGEPERDEENSTQNMLEILIDWLSSEPTNEEQSTGEGNTPPVVIPPGSAEALYKIYNPTESQINSFGAWLWSSNFVDQLLKMFNDPMQAIISLHKVFCSPSVGGTAEIKVGYLNSGVSSNYVDEQYVTVPCGSVQLNEDFQNVFDYPPFTEVSLYLPFIGIVRLDTNDVMRGTITVTYHVDVLTGSCLAEVSVIRDMYGGVLYQYAGDCSVHYPLSSGSYMGIVGALLGVAGTVASGGALAPMALGVASGVMGARSSVERSGGFSGNAGAMGSKKPYLIIQRPQTNMPTDFNKFIGKPANETVKISECTGFISCVEVHALNTICTESEMNELITLLKSGILI